MKVSVGFPVWGEAPEALGVRPIVELAAESGVDGLWVGDHLAMTRRLDSAYPHDDEGEFFLGPEDPWYEAVTVLSHVSALSGSMELGFGVLLPALRPPALLAKQIATLERLAGGGVVVGVGAGWMRAELEALGVPWEGRGRRLTDSIRVLREYWKGDPEPGEYGAFTIPEGITSYPTPRGRVPILVGGHTEPALRRAATAGDGWIGALEDLRDVEGGLASTLERFNRLRAELAPDGPQPSVGVVAALPGKLAARDDFTDLLADRLAAMRRLGVGRVVLNTGWRDLETSRRTLRGIREAADRTRTTDRRSGRSRRA